ncbi:MAG TPA: DegT/DnrJ/EryC1/StrS family aminotransferase [Chloroflexi bacterium]|nr:DegT/DnrJ/EryC1/StrS family aminotransferase [Chloroflexota bacterium]
MSSIIPLLDLAAQYQSIKTEIDEAVQRVLDSGRFILGEEVTGLEREMADYLGVSHGVGVASGTDALILALRALDIGEGDEVILPAYTFFATAGAVLHVGARPVLVDIDPRTYCLDVELVRAAVTAKTRAVIPVHLYGHPAEMDQIQGIAAEHGFYVIEDNAQAVGAEYQGVKTGSLGDLACLSFFPSKNLGAYGDAGMVVTDSAEIAERIRKLRVHGWKKKYHPEILGYNSRLDALQAAVLRVKLRHLEGWNQRRREIAAVYDQALEKVDWIQAPFCADNVTPVYHLYILQTVRREQLKGRLTSAGIASGIYYPQPLHLTSPCRELGYKEGDFPTSEKASLETLAIPIYPELRDGDLRKIIHVITSA